MNTNKKIIEWERVSAQLRTIKKQEMELRVDIVSEFDDLEFGTNYFHEFGIKIVRKQNIKIIESEFDDAYAEMDQSEQKCFKIKPSLIVSKYNEIESDIINSILISTPAAPTISVIKESRNE